MTRSYLVLSAAAALLFAPAVQARDAGVDATIGAFGTAFNKGDVPAAKALLIGSPTITDEVAPYAWSGPGAMDTWLGDLGKSEAAEGKTGSVVAIGSVNRELIDGDRAYAIAPATYTFMQKGMRMRETGEMTFVLAKGAGGWKIASFVWSSLDATPAP